VDAARARKLEAEVANIADILAQGIRSAGLLERLQATEAELERLRAAAKVVDIEAILAAIPGAVARYREIVQDLGNSPVDIAQAREVIGGIADRIPVRPGEDGVPVAHVARGCTQIGVVAGA
jgi:hypothetical protein